MFACCCCCLLACCCCRLLAAAVSLAAAAVACCCCFFVAVRKWLCIQLTLHSAVLMTHLSYMTLFTIYLLIDCTRMTSRPTTKQSTVTPLHNGYNIILKLQQKHHAKSCVIWWLLVYATSRNKQQKHWYHEKGHWSIGGWQQWCSVAALLKTEFRRRNGCLLILLSLW